MDNVKEFLAHYDVGDDESLAHYGVPGMKWGKRKSRSARSSKPSKDHRDARLIKGKPLHQMTNDELKRLNARNELESKFKKANPSTIERGQRKVKALMGAAAGAAALYNLAKSPAAKAGANFVKNAYFRANYVSGVTKAITS